MAHSPYRRRRREPQVEPSRDAAVAKMYAAGLKNLHRPNDPSDAYHTTDAVKALAERKTDD